MSNGRIKPADYTKDQTTAMKYITRFIQTEITEDIETYLCTLSGAAGTGKTTLTKEVIKHARRAGQQVLCVAPTHKARRVMHKIINTGTFLQIPTATVAGLLGKRKGHSYVGTQYYREESGNKMCNHDFFIIDEVSMIAEIDFNRLAELAKSLQKKILFIGDMYQIPHPSQALVRREDGNGEAGTGGEGATGTPYLVKGDSPAFHLANLQVLDKVVRCDDALLSVFSSVRAQIGHDIVLSDIAGLPVLTETLFHQKLVDNFNPLNDESRIIVYTNKAVDKYNKMVRKRLFKGGCNPVPIIKGELLTGYTNIEDGIQNGEDYRVQSIVEKDNHAIVANGKEYEALTGSILHLKSGPVARVEQNSASALSSLSVLSTSFPVFLPDLDSEENCQLLEDLVDLSVKVNKSRSTKKEYARYMALKAQVLFMEDIYCYTSGGESQILTSSEMKATHPLLFNHTVDALGDSTGSTGSDGLGVKINQRYPGLLARRAADNKHIIPTEKLVDMYQVLQRDLTYGYAITSHKSQGSTYPVVYIDEQDFHVLQDRKDRRTGLVIRNSLERDKLKYVAVSRASKGIYVLGVGTLPPGHGNSGISDRLDRPPGDRIS